MSNGPPNTKIWKLPTRADYDKAGPYEKGFMAYTFSQWQGSEIPSEKKNPFPVGSSEREQFADGVHAAMLCAQDSEE